MSQPVRPKRSRRRLLPLLGVALACNGSAPVGEEPALTLCTDPRPQMCTMDYVPVCGSRGSEWKTYSNGCSACSDAQVSGFRAGPCDD